MGQPVAFSRGWPLTADGWEAQMLFLDANGGHKNTLDCIEAFSETDFTSVSSSLPEVGFGAPVQRTRGVPALRGTRFEEKWE